MSVPYLSKASAYTVLDRWLPEGHVGPTKAMIEISDRCNEVCVHCYQVQGQKGEMTTEQIEGVLDELAEMGVLFVVISGGESTLRPDFLDIVKAARDRGFAVMVYTNGLRMTREMAKSLAELAVHEVHISLYSHHADVHDGVTGVPGSFEKTVAGIRYLTEYGVRVVTKCILMSLNAHEYEEFVDFASGLGADYMLDPTGMFAREDGDKKPEQFEVSRETLLRVLRNPKLLPQRTIEPARAEPDRRVCGACSGAVHVEPHGEIRPCAQMQVPIGNATRGIEKSWYGNPEARSIRAIRWADVHGCRDCELASFCHRCHAKGLSATGDALGPYPGACRLARTRYEAGLDRPLELLPAEDEDRDPEIGPYRVEGVGQLRPIRDVVTHEDRARARQYGWIRDRVPQPAGELVQIGRRRQSSDAAGAGQPPEEASATEA